MREEGKATLPLIYAFQHGTPAEAALIRRTLEQGGLDEMGPVLDAIRHTGAIEYTREQARVEAQAACATVARLPLSKILPPSLRETSPAGIRIALPFWLAHETGWHSHPLTARA